MGTAMNYATDSARNYCSWRVMRGRFPRELRKLGDTATMLRSQAFCAQCVCASACVVGHLCIAWKVVSADPRAGHQHGLERNEVADGERCFAHAWIGDHAATRGKIGPFMLASVAEGRLVSSARHHRIAVRTLRRVRVEEHARRTVMRLRHVARVLEVHLCIEFQLAIPGCKKDEGHKVKLPVQASRQWATSNKVRVSSKSAADHEQAKLEPARAVDRRFHCDLNAGSSASMAARASWLTACMRPLPSVRLRPRNRSC